MSPELEEATKLLIWKANEVASLIREALNDGYGADEWQEEASEAWIGLVDAMRAASGALCEDVKP